MALNPTDLKKGTIFLFNKELCESLDYKQKVMARQNSTVTVKLRFLKTNKVQTHTFQGGEDLEPAHYIKKTAQFLYADDQHLYFMDMDDFSQYSLDKQFLTDKVAFLTEGQEVILLIFDNQPLTIELPANVILKVTEAFEVVKGDTTSGLTKEVGTETGLTIKVPAFIKTGDLISVDTSNGNYRERQK